ncbi:hypothetical protein [Streptomyces sp. NBC_01353]|uniref:hypothetical protein n=1 Tax=Streptomyces sp. NBC_01353 TaxID=2903835 RepID=UPI002E3504B9|nr:hypothetical protein [Streptomyces sp. NBC_01353]
MTTPLRRRSMRARLQALISDATGRITAAWRILTTAQTRLLAALAAVRPGRSAPARIRAASLLFQQAIAAFDRAVAAFAERWAATDLPAAYREGALAAFDHVDRPHRAWTWTPRHQAAITSLTAQYYADLMGRLAEALRRARAFLRAAQDATRARLGRFTVPRFDQAELTREHPLDTVIYANDARHPVESWARAALSWQAVTTANAGAIRTAADQLGCDWMEVRDGPDCGWQSHQDPDRAHGTLRTVQDALAHPVAHANCQRQFYPRPDVISRPDYAFGGPF